MAQSISITLDLAALKTDAATQIYKWGQVNKDDANYQRIYHLQYGDDSNLDKHLIALYMKQRAERIADFMSEYLTDIVFGENVVPIGINHPNNPEPSPFLPPQRSVNADYVEYDLTLPGGWNPRTKEALIKHCEDYVVDGAVADWFTNVGNEQGAVYEKKATNHSTDIIRNIYHKNSTI